MPSLIDNPSTVAAPRNRFAAFRRPAIVGLILLFGFFYFQNLHRILGKEHHQADFFHFYAAAVAMSNGMDPYPSGTGGYVYPPLLAFLYIPLAHLPDQWAAAVALTINVPLVVGSLLIGASLAAKRFGMPEGELLPEEPAPEPGYVPVVAFLCAAITFGRLKAEIQMLQTDVIVLAAYCFAIYWLDRRPILAGTLLGFAMNIKYYTAPGLIYLIVRRRWSAASAFIVAMVAFALLPALKVGLHTDLNYLSVATGGVMKSIGVASSQEQTARVHRVYDALSISVTSGIARFCRRSHPGAVTPLTGLVIAFCIILAAVWYRLRRLPFLRWPNAIAQRTAPFRQLILLEWAGIMIASVAFSPDSNMRHMVLVLFANAVALALIFSASDAVPRIPLIAGLLIQFLAFDSTGRWPEPAIRFFFKIGGQGWCVLIFYALLLWSGLRSIGAGSNRFERAPLGIGNGEGDGAEAGR